MQVGLNVGHLHVGGQGGVTGVGGDPLPPGPWMVSGMEAELGKPGFYIFSYSLFYQYCIFLFLFYTVCPIMKISISREMILDKSLIDFWSNPWINKHILYTKVYGPMSLLVIVLLL